MAIKKLKPNTATTRYQSVLDYSELSKVAPHKALTETLNYKAGRSGSGRIAVRHKGGRVKRKYRIIDFKRNKLDIPGSVHTIEYDPNRSANIALIKYADGEYRYIIAPDGLKIGQEVISASEMAPVKEGNTMAIKSIPLGALIHNIELNPGKGGQMARSAGSFASISGRDKDYVIIKLPSGEMRKVHNNCRATIGVVGNKDHSLVSIGKAGRNRWKGIRPAVRGVVMNPVDHPHGGGEGKTSGGRHPVTPWGQPTRGYKTRAKNKKSSKFIIQRRINKRIGK
jgi:large subunit ribosomal protein L2